MEEQYCDILLYLDREGYLVKMKEASIMFLRELCDNPNQKFLPFKYLLNLDVMNLIDVAPDIGMLLLEEPLIWQKMASDILYSCLQSIIHDVDYTILPEQVRVHLRLNCVPTPLVQPNKCFSSGLVSFKGLLVSLTKIESYVYHSVWSCQEDCDDNEVILHSSPKTPPKCAVCRGVLYENSGQRRCGDKVVATFLLGDKAKPKTITIVDDLISQLQLGSMFLLVGYTVKKTTTILCVEAAETTPPAPTVRHPSDIHKLLTKCKAMPWKFIYCLASGIGVDVCPLSCFMHLKISLLLSLASVAGGGAALHVLARGADSSRVPALLAAAARLAPRSCSLPPARGAVPAALLASSGGVCALPLPLHAYSPRQVSQLLSAIENGEVVTASGACRLRCAVWAQGADLARPGLGNAGSVFGGAACGDRGEHAAELADFLLAGAAAGAAAGGAEAAAAARGERELRRWLAAAAGARVPLSREAEALLRGYFVAARREGGAAAGAGAGAGGLRALAAASAAAARLCGRGAAGAADAALAAWLHAAAAEPRAAPEDCLRAAADVRDAARVLARFTAWLRDFTGLDIQL